MTAMADDPLKIYRIFHNTRGEVVVNVYGEHGKSARQLPLYLEHVSHSPTGFGFGYAGSGPSQLAFALCFDVLQNVQAALSIYQDFKRAVVAPRSPGEPWDITSSQIRKIIDDLKQGEAA